jgi:hypothetical protein
MLRFTTMHSPIIVFQDIFILPVDTSNIYWVIPVNVLALYGVFGAPA